MLYAIKWKLGVEEVEEKKDQCVNFCSFVSKWEFWTGRGNQVRISS